MKYSYAAVFYPDENCVAVHFVDNEHWLTVGENLADAILNAAEALNYQLLNLEKNGITPPPPTPIEKVKLGADQTVRMIDADTDEFAAKAAQALQRAELERADNPIKALRELKGWSIKELADYLDAPYRTVQDWNSGKNRPPRWCEKLIIDKIWSN